MHKAHSKHSRSGSSSPFSVFLWSSVFSPILPPTGFLGWSNEIINTNILDKFKTSSLEEDRMQTPYFMQNSATSCTTLSKSCTHPVPQFPHLNCVPREAVPPSFIRRQMGTICNYYKRTFRPYCRVGLLNSQMTSLALSAVHTTLISYNARSFPSSKLLCLFKNTLALTS